MFIGIGKSKRGCYCIYRENEENSYVYLFFLITKNYLINQVIRDMNI